MRSVRPHFDSPAHSGQTSHPAMVVSASSICGLLVFLIIIPFLQWNLYQWISSSSSHAPSSEDDDTPSPFSFVTGSGAQNQNHQPSQSIELQINKLKRIAYANPEGSQPFIESWQQILDLDGRNLEAHVVSTFYLLLISFANTLDTMHS